MMVRFLSLEKSALAADNLEGGWSTIKKPGGSRVNVSIVLERVSEFIEANCETKIND